MHRICRSGPSRKPLFWQLAFTPGSRVRVVGAAARATTHPLGLPISLGPTAHQQSSPGGDGTSATPQEVHLHRHQQLGVVVQGVDAREHARVIAEAENAVSNMRHEAQAFRTRAEQQISNTQHEAQSVAAQAQQQIDIAKQQAQSVVMHAQQHVDQATQRVQAQMEHAQQHALQAESTIADLRQRNAQLEQQQEEMRQQMVLLQSMVPVASGKCPAVGYVPVSCTTICKADPNMTAVAEAMKALATHVWETMNELKQTFVANSCSASPKARAKVKKAKAKSVGISASEPAAAAASPPPSSIQCLSSPMAFPSYTPYHQLPEAIVAKSIASAPPPPPPGPDVYDLASQQEKGEEEEGYGQGWFEDDPIVDVNFSGNDLPRPASV